MSMHLARTTSTTIVYVHFWPIMRRTSYRCVPADNLLDYYLFWIYINFKFPSHKYAAARNITAPTAIADRLHVRSQIVQYRK
jgi:hypothetical protein